MHNRKKHPCPILAQEDGRRKKAVWQSWARAPEPTWSGLVLSFKKCLLHVRDEQLREVQAGHLKC